MKKLYFLICILLAAGFTTAELKLTEEEREKGIEELKRTKEMLASAVEDLNDDQLDFKATPESWSIAEIVEHLTISEHAFEKMLQGALQTPADMAKRSEVKFTDDELMGMITDRTNKVKTSEAFEPSGKFGSYEETLEAFYNKRGEHIEYLKNTEDDLRHHYGELPFGTIDGYQVLLFMSGHVERHVKQIEEVMDNDDFPSE